MKQIFCLAVLCVAVSVNATAKEQKGTIPPEAWQALERLIIPPAAVLEYVNEDRQCLYVSRSESDAFGLYELADYEGTSGVWRFLRKGNVILDNNAELQPAISERIVYKNELTTPNDIWATYHRTDIFWSRVTPPFLVTGGVRNIAQLLDNRLAESEFDGQKYICSIHTNLRHREGQETESTLKFIFDPIAQNVVGTLLHTQEKSIIFWSEITYGKDGNPREIKTSSGTYKIYVWNTSPGEIPELEPLLIGAEIGCMVNSQGENHPYINNTFPGVWNGQFTIWENPTEMTSNGRYGVAGDLSNATTKLSRFRVAAALWDAYLEKRATKNTKIVPQSRDKTLPGNVRSLISILVN